MNILCKMCDNVATKVCETACQCSKALESSSSSGDSNNTLWICLAIVAIAIIAAITLSIWHQKELDAKKNQENSSSPDIPQQEKDKREYIAKLISFKEELSKKESKLKAYDDTACQDYITLLTQLAQLKNQKQTPNDNG